MKMRRNKSLVINLCSIVSVITLVYYTNRMLKFRFKYPTKNEKFATEILSSSTKDQDSSINRINSLLREIRHTNHSIGQQISTIQAIQAKVIRRNSTKHAKGTPLNCIDWVQNMVHNGTLLIPDDTTLQQLNVDELTCLYKQYMRSVQYLCTNKVLLGGIGEASYTICDDSRYQLAPPCTVLIITDVLAGESFRQFNTEHRCDIHLHNQRALDETRSYGSLTVHSTYQIGLQDWWCKSLDFIYNETFQNTQGGNEILILDVMSDYLSLMEKHLKEGFFKRFRQIVLRPTLPLNRHHLHIFRQLYDEGFRIHHLETNIHIYLRRDVTGPVLSFINVIKDIKEEQNEIRAGINKYPNIEKASLNGLQNPGEFYFNYLRSPQIQCKMVLRLGKDGDGGWEICTDEQYRPKKPCLVYSFGINFDFSFDDDISSKYGCEVHSFDPSMRDVKDHKRSSLVTFHDIGLADVDMKKHGWTYKTIQSIRASLGHLNRTVDVLKIDIEKDEIKILPKLISSGHLDTVRQLVFEIHTEPRHDKDKQYRTELSLLKSLYNYGLRIFWSHANLWGSFVTRDSLTKRTHAYEIHMLNTRYATGRSKV